MNSKTLSILFGAALLGVLLYLNFTWDGPDGLLELGEWKAEGSPSWVEWQLDQLFD